MGKTILRIIWRMLGLCIVLIALLFGVAKINQFYAGGQSKLIYYMLSGLLWFLFGALLPFFTARHRVRFALSLEHFICCVLCIILVWGISQTPGFLPGLIREQAQLLQELLLLAGGVFLNRTFFNVH